MESDYKRGLIPKPSTKFLKVKCSGCGNEQAIFSAASREVKCLKCNATLARPGASNAAIEAKVLNEMEWHDD